jgi:type IV fimbrial biogenesis protein FimT
MNLRLRSSGFTLTELMIGIVVAAILITLAVPNFRLLVQNNRISSTTNNFFAAINLARAEAVKRGTPVFICRTDDSEASPPACQRANGAVHSGNWSRGWLIYAVPPTAITTGGDYVDGTDVLVRLGGGTSDGVRITSDTEGNYALGYKADGMTFELDEARYAICDDRNESAGKLIRIPLTGRAFLESTSVAADRDCSPT